MPTHSAKALTPEMPARRAREAPSLEHSGMVIFLGAWVMMFGALFFSYAVLRVSAPVWPPPGFVRLPLALPGIGTLLLLASSWTLGRALASARRGLLTRYRTGLLQTLALGVAFVALQCKLWTELWKGGLHLDSGAYGGTFYLLTVFHIVHVIVGLGLLLRLVAPLVGRADTPPGPNAPTLTAMFWHFVDVVWLVTFVAVYVL